MLAGMGSRLRSAGWDGVVAFFTAGAVFIAVFALGRISLAPAWTPSPGAVTDTTVAGGSGQGTSLDDPTVVPTLQAIVDDMFGFGAAAAVTGAIDDRLIFGQVDHFSIEPTYSCVADDCTSSPTPPTEGPPIKLSIAYVGDGTKFSLIASVPDLDTPFSEGVTPVLAVGAQSFIAHSGDCTMTLSSFEFSGLAGRFSSQDADIGGRISCVDVADVRSGATVSYTAVFILKTLDVGR